MRKNIYALSIVSAVLAMILNVTSGGGIATAGGGMGGGRGMAAASQRPDKAGRLAVLSEIEKQIAAIRNAIEAAPAQDPNIATLEGEALTNFTTQYTRENDAVNQLAQRINSLRPTTGGRGGRGGFGRTSLTTDTLSELLALAQSEKAATTIERLDVLLDESQANAPEQQYTGGDLYTDSTNTWKVHDMSRPAPIVVTPGSIPLQDQVGAAPSNAIVLFDGRDLSQWAAERGGEPGWIVRDGYTECVRGSGGIVTKQGFGSCQLHVEFATPANPSGTGQNRGNSGVILMNLYEIQILDSYENTTYPDGQCGAIYGRNVPMVNVCRKPGEWQSYDIIFHRPIFDDNDVKKKATFTVFQNGVLIHDNVELQGGTAWMGATMISKYAPHADKMPLRLQDHNNPIRFRNVWIRELED
jgi:hypothetical protein